MAYIQILEFLMTLVREKILYLVDGPNIVKWHDNGFHYLESIFHAAEDLQPRPEALCPQGIPEKLRLLWRYASSCRQSPEY